MALSEAQRRAIDAIADSMAIMCKGRGLLEQTDQHQEEFRRCATEALRKAFPPIPTIGDRDERPYCRRGNGHCRNQLTIFMTLSPNMTMPPRMPRLAMASHLVTLPKPTMALMMGRPVLNVATSSRLRPARNCRVSSGNSTILLTGMALSSISFALSNSPAPALLE